LQLSELYFEASTVGVISQNGVTVIKRIKADRSRANADEE
jgi:hypothetical protein